jgi:nicotinate-nucleotide adenylyltransferase
MKRAASRAIALFGGSFDPIHAGHLAVARAAVEAFGLDQVIFIPSGIPPHKRRQRLASFTERYAMVALACAGEPRFVPSLSEAGEDGLGRQVIYSVDTVRRFRKLHPSPSAKLYFILGADQFLDIAKWHQSAQLLRMCDFIVANRPGFGLDHLRSAVEPKLLRRAAGEPEEHGKHQTIELKHTTVHVLESVASDVSATEIRQLLAEKKSIRALVPPLVEEYIEKQGLYR